jgi:hypothetical protein
MIDDESELRQRFDRLRAEERSGVPRFSVPRRQTRRSLTWRLIAVPAALLLIVALFVITRPRPVAFSDSDRAAVRSVSAWHPPTDFLLRTPGSEMLSTTPRIPDLKGIPQ